MWKGMNNMKDRNSNRDIIFGRQFQKEMRLEMSFICHDMNTRTHVNSKKNNQISKQKSKKTITHSQNSSIISIQTCINQG